MIAGFIVGTVGFAEHPLTPWILLIFTYVPAGIIAGRRTRRPYLSAGLTGFMLSIFNQGFALLAFGPEIMEDILTMFLSFLIGLAFIFLGALIADRPWKKPLSTAKIMDEG